MSNEFAGQVLFAKPNSMAVCGSGPIIYSDAVYLIYANFKVIAIWHHLNMTLILAGAPSTTLSTLFIVKLFP